MALNEHMAGSVKPLMWASVMASVDAISLGIMKKHVEGKWSGSTAVPLSMGLYALQPLLFLQSLQYESMTVMNILWDIISDFMVTAVGLFYFKEKLTSLKYFGLTLAFIAVVILSYDELRGP